MTTGGQQMTEAANNAMDALKTNRVLEENIFILTKDNLPSDDHADPYGNIMVHAPYIGWRCCHIKDLKDHIDIYLCDHWTFTPPLPPPVSNHD